MTATQTTVEVVRDFIEALNARDLEALSNLTAEDAQFPTPQGKVLVGHEAVKDIVNAAADSDIVLVRNGAEEVDDQPGGTRVTVPVKEIIGKSDISGTAQFLVRDGKVAGFEVITQMTRDQRSSRAT
jgi:hypothetical protein